jgi:6-phosphofructokinase 1
MQIGILTSGGDCPGLNAAIRGVARAAIDRYGMNVIGFRDGFRGLVLDRTVAIDKSSLSGILTHGGTFLGTSRDKPHRMPIGGKEQNMVDAAVETVRKHRLDALVCIGGGGTQKNAMRLHKAGVPVLTLPKTIDNDIAGTELSFGFDTALEIATEAVDRLHSTAMSHGRIIVVEIMGHRAGWLALGAGIAGGADVILIPEIPYEPEKVAKSILRRTREGKNFSIVVVAEGAMSVEQAGRVGKLAAAKAKATSKADKQRANTKLEAFYSEHVNHTLELTRSLEGLTGLESRLTILGHLQRGGTPSAADRLLATRLGTACADAIHRGESGVMVAARGSETTLVPLSETAGSLKLVPPDHAWIATARAVGTGFGD